MLDFDFIWALLAFPLPLLIQWLAPARREVVEAIRLPFFEGASAGLDRSEGALVRRRTLAQMMFAWMLWALILATLARPAWVGDPIERTEAARDVMLAVDISQSMTTKDFADHDGTSQTRLDGVKSVLDGFVAERRDDRLGLIVFGSAAYVLVPFTQDTDAARYLLGTLQPGMAGKDTMLGDAIGLAIQSFKASSVEARVMILLSDGSDTGSRMAPAKAADIAAQNGVVIHTIAVGDPEGTGDTKVDIAALQDIAQTTGGTFNRAEDAAGLSQIYDQIDALGAREGTSVSWRPRTSLTAIPAACGAALVLLVYIAALLVTRLRRHHAGKAEATA